MYIKIPLFNLVALIGAIMFWSALPNVATATVEHSYLSPSSTSSSPIALSHADKLLWVVNSDENTVSVIRTDSHRLIKTIRVGKEPKSITVSRQGRFAFVANAKSNSVSVIEILNADPEKFKAKRIKASRYGKDIVTGSEPRSVVLSPDDKKLFVANASQDTITVVETDNLSIIGNINLRDSQCNVGDKGRHFHPRGLAVSKENNMLYVARFLSFTNESGRQSDDMGKNGLICRIKIDTNSLDIYDYQVDQFVELAPAYTGMLDKNGNDTYAFANQMQHISIRDDKLYLPNIAASPSGPQRFDTNTQAFVSRVDNASSSMADGGAINLHLGGRDPEQGKPELYFANPWSIAFTNEKGVGSAYVVSAGSDILVKLDVNEQGVLGFTHDTDTTRYIDLNNPDDLATSGENAGKNPLGIVIDDAANFAYVLNYISRNVSVVDLRRDEVVKVVQVSDLPVAGSKDEQLLVGAEMFFSSRGYFLKEEGAAGSNRNRLSEKGRQNCASCHAEGLTDGVIWQFASGPRKTLAVNGTFNPHNPDEQKIINASAVFDEVEDADFNTRLVSSPGFLIFPQPCVGTPSDPSIVTSKNDPDHGLILGEDGNFEFGPCEMNQFARPNANRPQPQVQLPGSYVKVDAHDALIEWQKLAIRTPNSPMTEREFERVGQIGINAPSNKDIRKGRRLFKKSGCTTCHSGGSWTKSRKDFVSPPAEFEIATESGVDGVNGLQFLPRFLNDIGSYGLNVAGGENIISGYPPIGGLEIDTNGLAALGFDYNGDGKGDGFNTSSILGSFSVPPYYHNGACETLECVVSDVSHRRAGLESNEPDPLDLAEARRQLVVFLESIDGKTNIFD